MLEVDVRGFSCPVPVVRTKKAMEQNPKEVLTVLTETAVTWKAWRKEALPS